MTDGLYPFACVDDGTQLRTLAAERYVEVRLAFGARNRRAVRLEKFDLVLDPETRGRWASYGFATGAVRRVRRDSARMARDRVTPRGTHGTGTQTARVPRTRISARLG